MHEPLVYVALCVATLRSLVKHYVSNMFLAFMFFVCLPPFGNFSVHPSATPLTHATCFATEYAASQEKHCRCCRSDNKKRQKHPDQSLSRLSNGPMQLYLQEKNSLPKHASRSAWPKKTLFYCKLQHQRKQKSCQPSKTQKVQLATPPKQGPGKKQSHQESIKGSWICCGQSPLKWKTFQRKRSLQGRSQHALMCSKPLRHAVIIINILMSWPQSNLCWIP